LQARTKGATARQMAAAGSYAALFLKGMTQVTHGSGEISRKCNGTVGMNSKLVKAWVFYFNSIFN